MLSPVQKMKSRSPQKTPSSIKVSTIHRTVTKYVSEQQRPRLLTEEEENLLNIAVNEYNDLFPQILTITQKEFLASLEKYIKISLPQNINFPSGTIAKIINIINAKNYEPDYSRINKIIQSIDDIKSCEVFKGKNFIPHCNKTKIPIHSCGEKFFILTNNEFLCLKCKMIYNKKCIKFHCDYCDVDYYTCIKPQNDNPKYQPATWVKYHCSAYINDVMKCSRCHNALYLNTYNYNLCCLKCNTETEQQDIKWKCIICKQDFCSEAKVYNPLECKIMKMAVKTTLFNGVEAKPDYVPCCDIQPNEIKQYKFQHKKECNGLLYEGTLNKRKIVVCSKCHLINYFEYHFWMCPICKERFTLKETSKVSSPSRLRKEKPAGVRNNSVILRYDTPEGNTPAQSSQSTKKTSFSSYNYYAKSPETRRSGRMTSQEESDSAEGSTSNSFIKHCRHSSSQYVKGNSEKKPYNREFELKLQDAGSGSANNTLRDHMSPNPKLLSSIAGGININLNVNINDANDRKISIINNVLNPLKQREEQYHHSRNSSSTIASSNGFNSDNYTIVKQIGEGTFGKIYEVNDPEGKRFAMKKILTSSKNEIQALCSEYEMLSSLSSFHLNLVQIYGMETRQLDKTTYAMYVLMDIAINDWEKEIEHRKTRKNFYTEKEIRKITKELVHTFAELQRHNISHRDIKPQNILLFEDKSFRIADFGEAKEIMKGKGNKDTLKQTIRGTELYMSPILFHALREKGLSQKYTEHNTYKSDVFSLGLCMLLAATLTFNSLVDIRELDDMISIKMVLGKYLKGRYSSQFVEFLYSMLEVDEKIRNDFIGLEKYAEYL